jgi:pyridoxal phosphate enzyme (YggS family)
MSSEGAGQIAEIAGRYERIAERAARAAERSGRKPDAVTLIAVAKTHPVEAIRAAFAAGARDFGENYVQELRAKLSELNDAGSAARDAHWHFIGRLQKNKAKDIIGRVTLVHTVDDLELAGVLARRAAAAGLNQDFLVEVNLAGERTKAGCYPDDLGKLLDGIAALPDARDVRCLGLMAIPPPASGKDDNRRHFRALAELARKHALPVLSMGMSGDFEVAIEEGATHVRVGTSIFGLRPPKP